MSTNDISPTQSPALSVATQNSTPVRACLQISSSPSRTTNMLFAWSPSPYSRCPSLSGTTRANRATRSTTLSGNPAKTAIFGKNARSASGNS